MQKSAHDERIIKLQQQIEKVKSICKSILTLQGDRCMFYFMRCKKKVGQLSKADILLVLKSAPEDNSLKIIDKPPNNTQIMQRFLQTQHTQNQQIKKIEKIHEDGKRLIIRFKDRFDKQVQFKCYFQNKQIVRQWIRVLHIFFPNIILKKTKLKQEEQQSQNSEQPTIYKMIKKQFPISQNRDKKESRQIKIKQTQEQNLQKTKDTFTAKISNQTQVSQYKKKILDLERQIQDLTNRLKMQIQKNQNLMLQNSQIKQQVSQFENRKNQNLQNLSVMKQLNQQKDKLEGVIQNLQQSLLKKDTIIRNLQDDLKIVKLNQNVNNEKRQNQIQKFKTMLFKNQSEEQNRTKQKQTLQFQIKKMKNQIQKLISNEYTMKNIIESSQYLHMFEGDILQNSNCFKQYLKSQIQNVTCNEILKTKILYKYDPRNISNFHNYIDGVEHIILIVKTQSGSYLAAFTESAFRSGQVPKGRGLIFALNNMKVFYLYEDKKAISYDDFYIIFGNSQIRIRTQQNKIFSNFGINNGFYNSDGYKIDMLLNEGNNREVLIESYQVHQIVYKNYF